MGIGVLVLGESGTGKSTSMRNFKKGDVLVLNVAGKRLPFKTDLERIDNAGYAEIGTALKDNKYKRYVIDDSQYLLAFEMFDRAKETGYGKFTDIAVRFRNMLKYVAEGTSDDTIVYLMHHTEKDDTGKLKAKTVGKMLDNQLTVEGLFSIVLLTDMADGTYRFITNGLPPAKSPIGMFEQSIDNDLAAVDKTIREYWGIK